MQSIAPYSIFGHTITPGELLIGSIVLLTISILLLIFNRRQKIALRRSVVTDELMVHLVRIGDLLERLETRPIQVVMPETTRHPDDASPQRLPDQTHTIPYSMFGR